MVSWSGRDSNGGSSAFPLCNFCFAGHWWGVCSLGLAEIDEASVTVHIPSFDDFDKFNAVCREIFSTDPPARTTVQVVALIGDARLELQTIAVKP